jgi:hypothetical protein
MNDLERQLQAMQLAAPPETLDRRMEAAFSAAADSSEGGARCPPLDRPFRQAQGPEPVEGLGALSLPNGQRASERQPEFSNQRVGLARRGGDNALHLRSPESGRARAATARRPRRRVALFAWLAGLGATVIAVGLILFASRPATLTPSNPSEGAVVYRLESTGLMRQFLTETPANQRPLPRFTVGVIAPPAPTTPSQPNPSS